MVRCPEKAEFFRCASRNTNPHNFFSTKSSIHELLFTSLCGHIYQLLSNYLSNIFMPILECSSLQLYVTSHLEWPSDQLSLLEHVYMRPEVNSNQFEISNHCERLFLLHGKFTTVKLQISNLFQIFFHLHGDFTATTFQTTVRF